MHELCHLVMRLIFENNDFPYYKNDDIAKMKFIEICESILKKITITDEAGSETYEDYCEGIISTVFTNYLQANWHPELVVRPLQILAHFDGNPEKLNYLNTKYKDLFDYIDNYILPELKKFSLSNRESIKQINDIDNIITAIEKQNIQLSSSKIIDAIVASKFSYIRTNILMLLLFDVYQYLSKKEMIPTVNNVFIYSNIEINMALYKKLIEILKSQPTLKVFVIWREKINIEIIMRFKKLKNHFVFISPKNVNLSAVLDIDKVSIVDYEFSDLLMESREELINIKINFQSNENATLKELLGNESKAACGVESELLNMLVNKFPININTKINYNFDKKLYQSRGFMAYENECRVRLTEETLLLKTKNYQKILISDHPKTGKSLSLKHIAHNLSQKYPNNWISLIELKHYSKAFEEQKSAYNFQEFTAQNMLKLNNIEANLFKALYNIGSTIILFDGFNEIPKNIRINFLKFCESQAWNNGNQLWITTRIDCKNMVINNLKGIVDFQLEPLSESHGFNIISQIWLNEDKKAASEFDVYYNQAQLLCESILKQNKINTPIFYQILAKQRNKKENSKNSLAFNVIKMLIENYSNKPQNDDSRIIHHYHAINTEAPNLINCCSINPSSISDDDLINCGLMVKFNETFIFQNNVIKYFLIAEFITTHFLIRQVDKCENYSKLIITVLITERFQTIRLFLDGALSDDKTIQKLKIILENFVEHYNENIEKILEILFKEKLLNITKLILSLIKGKEYDKIKDILLNHLKILMAIETDAKILHEIFIISAEYLESEDLQSFIESNQVLFKMIQINLDVNNLEEILVVIEAKINSDFVRQMLRKVEENGTLLHYLCKFKDFEKLQLDKFFKILNDFLREPEIAKILSTSNDSQKNIFHICVIKGDKELFNYIYSKLNEYLNDKKLVLIEQYSNENSSILHTVALSDKLYFHERIWKILVETIKDHKDLIKLIQHRNENGETFLHLIMKFQELEIIKATLENIEIDCKDLDVTQVRNSLNRNLLHEVIYHSIDLKTLKYIWNTFKYSSQNINKWDFLNEIDGNNSNIIQLAAQYLNNEALIFVFNQTRIITTPKEFERMLKEKNGENKSLLELAEMNKNNTNAYNFLQNIIDEVEVEKLKNSNENGNGGMYGG